MEFPGSAVTYVAAVATLDPSTHCAEPGMEPAPWCCGDAANPAVPQWELLTSLLECLVHLRHHPLANINKASNNNQLQVLYHLILLQLC